VDPQNNWACQAFNGVMRIKMDGCGALLKITRASVCNGLAIAVLAAALTFLATAIPPAFAEDNTPSAPDQPVATAQQCLGCHGSAGMEKRLEDGGTLQLHVPGDMFAKSVHRVIGCAGIGIGAIAHY
jgi:mono/diheme cytochrome c family protein